MTSLGVDGGERSPTRASIQEFGVAHPHGQDVDGSTAVDGVVSGIPKAHIIDRQGRLVARFVRPITVEQLTQTVRSINS